MGGSKSVIAVTRMAPRLRSASAALAGPLVRAQPRSGRVGSLSACLSFRSAVWERGKPVLLPLSSALATAEGPRNSTTPFH